MHHSSTHITHLWLGLLALVLLFSANVSANTIKGEAPDFTLKSHSGENIKLSEYRGQIVLINFWASWCGPCRQEMPELEKLYKKYSKLGVTIFGVNVEENINDAKNVVTNSKLSFPVLFDTENVVSQLYNVTGMPTTIIVDRDGNMRYLHRSYKPGDENQYRTWIKQLIRE